MTTPKKLHMRPMSCRIKAQDHFFPKSNGQHPHRALLALVVLLTTTRRTRMHIGCTLGTRSVRRLCRLLYGAHTCASTLRFRTGVRVLPSKTTTSPLLTVMVYANRFGTVSEISEENTTANDPWKRAHDPPVKDGKKGTIRGMAACTTVPYATWAKRARTQHHTTHVGNRETRTKQEKRLKENSSGTAELS